MPGALIATLLVVSLLLVHFSTRRAPMPATRPLNVDDGLLLPEAGQASTVFSLTALFGAYFGIFVVLGWPALAGLGFGSAIGLWAIRRWFTSRPNRSFEGFLYGIFVGNGQNSAVLGLLLIAIQCGFATSEVLILREIAKSTLGLRAEHATLAAVALSLIGYFYVLFGGYRAVFRTDVLQFVLVAAMGLILIVGVSADATTEPMVRWPRPGYWMPPVEVRSSLTYLYQFSIAAVMGFVFLAASPDTWKRVFVVTRSGRPQRRFFVFVLAGIAPFLVLVPLASRTPGIPDGPTYAGVMFASLLTNNVLFVATSLGMIASFLSAFNGALIGSVQVGLILRRAVKREAVETPRFHWLMVTTLLSITALFMALLTLAPNPYFLGSILLGPYMLVGGIQLGTLGVISRLREGVLLWIVAMAMAAWCVFIASGPPLVSAPSTYQLNAVPGGIMLCFAVAVICWLTAKPERKRSA